MISKFEDCSAPPVLIVSDLATCVGTTHAGSLEPSSGARGFHYPRPYRCKTTANPTAMVNTTSPEGSGDPRSPQSRSKLGWRVTRNIGTTCNMPGRNTTRAHKRKASRTPASRKLWATSCNAQISQVRALMRVIAFARAGRQCAKADETTLASSETLPPPTPRSMPHEKHRETELEEMVIIPPGRAGHALACLVPSVFPHPTPNICRPEPP